MTTTIKIYTDIESLLDIRQAILHFSVDNTEELVNFINSNEYNFREKDQFSIADQSKYIEINSNKNTDLLPYSTITYITHTIKNKLLNVEKRNSYYGTTSSSELVVNTYPFTLTDNQIYQLQNLLFVKLKTNNTISIIYMKPEELTPYFISTNNIISCFIYDFSNWLNYHLSSIEKNKILDCLLYFPSLKQKDVDKSELTEITKSGFKDPFSYLEFTLSQVANVNFLPVVFYSNIITATGYLTKFDSKLTTDKYSEIESDISKEEIEKYVDKVMGDLDGNSSPEV